MKNNIILLLLLCLLSATPAFAQMNEAEQLAQAQLDAYNARDIEAFLLPYSDSVKVYKNLRDFAYQGKERMRAGYTSYFESVDSLYCKLENRIVMGNIIVDQEEVS
ncbi:MAG: nuclear transport factor 2 family protein, partial [Bacteroidota bacterium]